MRKKLITAIITAALLIAGCSDTANVSAGQENTMVLVESGQEYLIYADNDTGVMYLYITISTGGGLTVCSMLMVRRRSGGEKNRKRKF